MIIAQLRPIGNRCSSFSAQKGFSRLFPIPHGIIRVMFCRRGRFYERASEEDTVQSRSAGPCGCGENYPFGGFALCIRRPADFGPGGSPGCVSGYPRLGAGQGHHHFLQAGPAGYGTSGCDIGGYPGPRGFFRGGGAHHAGSGLRGAGDQRHRRGAGPHGDLMAAVGKIPGAGGAVHQ